MRVSSFSSNFSKFHIILAMAYIFSFDEHPFPQLKPTPPDCAPLHQPLGHPLRPPILYHHFIQHISNPL